MQTYRFKYSDLIIAERQYPWIDRVLILWVRDRRVLDDLKFSDLPMEYWELVTPQGENSES